MLETKPFSKHQNQTQMYVEECMNFSMAQLISIWLIPIYLISCFSHLFLILLSHFVIKGNDLAFANKLLKINVTETLWTYQMALFYWNFAIKNNSAYYEKQKSVDKFEQKIMLILDHHTEMVWLIILAIILMTSNFWSVSMYRHLYLWLS